jgi:hypothetical protein
MILDTKELTLKQMGFLDSSLDYKTVDSIANYWLDTQLLYEEAVKQGLDKDEKVKFITDINSKKMAITALINKAKGDIKITDQEVRKYYDQNKETDPNLKEPSYLSFSHITVESLSQAESVLEKVNAGGDINQLAKELSTASDAKRGGKADKYRQSTIQSRFGDDFLNALLGAAEGQVIGPVKNKNGKYEIARCEGQKTPKLKDFEKVSQQIKTNLEAHAGKNVVKDLIDSLRNNAKHRFKKAGILSEKDNEQKNGQKKN